MPHHGLHRVRFLFVVLLCGWSEPGAASAERCERSLQSIIDQARPYQKVVVPACLYREAITINQPIQLVAEPGAEIRGSDVWSLWELDGGLWRSRQSVPPLPAAHGVCAEGTVQRCQLPEQVFIEGQPLEQVLERPGRGQFALDADRRILLGESPSNRQVEVSVRRYWVLGASDNVGIHGFRMRHAANDAQWFGALRTSGHSGWTIAGNVLSDAHGALVSLCSSGGSNNRLLDNELFRSGWLAVHGHACDGALVQGNHIHHNNTEGFSADWAAGGIKMATARHVVFADNRIHDNAGHGVWCDIDCDGIVYRGNAVHDNGGVGVFHEISGRARILDNRIWGNGWRMGAWGTGAGILSQGSRDVRIANNTLAWNADGIVVVSTQRHQDPEHPWNRVTGNTVVNNLIVMADTCQIGRSTGQLAIVEHEVLPARQRCPSASHVAVGFIEQLPWLSYWPGGVLFKAGSGNFAGHNDVARTDPQYIARNESPAVNVLSMQEALAKLRRAGIPDHPAGAAH